MGKIKPRFSSGFEMCQEGLHMFRTKKADVTKAEEGSESEKLFRVESEVEGGEVEGSMQFDTFPLKSKKSFGLERMAGFLIKLKVIKDEALKKMTNDKGEIEFDEEMFATEKFENMFKMAVPGKLFGGRVRHVKSKKSGDLMSNIVEYFTEKELIDEMKRDTEKKAKKGKGFAAGGGESDPEKDKEEDMFS